MNDIDVNVGQILSTCFMMARISLRISLILLRNAGLVER